MPDRVGEQFGNYRLVRLLGHGSFAEVYLGQHLHLNRQAAIKVMDTRLSQPEMEAFRREARIVADLQHPHIVQIIDFDMKNRVPYLVLQYAPNGSLRERYPRGTVRSLETILPYVRQIAGALQYVHDHKLIHLDVKPANLLLGPQNEVLLSDFGLTVIAQSTRSQLPQSTGGTLSYMAPEQIEGRPRPASDQYALGIIVYEWLSGEPPFQGTNPTQITVQHLRAQPAPLRDKVPSIAPAIEQVILKALTKDPHQRFSSVAEFATALQRANESEKHLPGPVQTSIPPVPTPLLAQLRASGWRDAERRYAALNLLKPAVKTKKQEAPDIMPVAASAGKKALITELRSSLASMSVWNKIVASVVGLVLIFIAEAIIFGALTLIPGFASFADYANSNSTGSEIFGGILIGSIGLYLWGLWTNLWSS